MKRTILALFTTVALTACSGSGTSTTDRESETDDTSADTETTDTPTSGGTTETPTTGAETTDGPTTGGTTDDATTDAETDTAADTTGDPTEGETGTTTGMDDVTIVGNWLSEGDNVAPILVQLANTASIAATFEDMSYDVLTTDGDGQEVQFSGVYTVEASGTGNIMNITLEQSAPSVITSQGIYEIDNSTNPPTMTYEVVQTIPDIAAELPTAEAGFGGTNLGADLTQVFVWQE